MKTAEELKMSQQEFDALLKVRDMLASGQIEHRNADNYDDGKGPKRGFDMNMPAESYSCGSAMCIGGWMKFFMIGGKPNRKGICNITPDRDTVITRYVHQFGFNNERSDEPLATLFYPDVSGKWEQLTPNAGVAAIDNFLHTGDANWAEAQYH